MVIYLHGCSGLHDNQRLWSERLLGWGYGSLVVDSFTPRGVANVCAPERQGLVTRFDRAADVVAAVRWLQAQPGVHPQHIAVLGESHGGGTAATLTLHPYADALDGAVKAVIDYYGVCRDPARYAGLPLLTLAGDADDWGKPAAACTRFGAAIPADSPMEQAIYPGAVHAFDNPNLARRIFNTGHPMQYDQNAAEDSFARVHRFLDRTIGPPG